MKKAYQIVTRAEQHSAAVIEQFCQTNGQILLPLVDLLQSASQVVDTVLHQVGLEALQLILRLSAEQVAGPRTPGKASGDIRWHGSQPGQVQLADRKLKVQRPRLRHKATGEVKIPAYEALQNEATVRERMLAALLRGVSTRDYESVLPAMAATVGVSKSAVSRKAIEASAAHLAQLRDRRWEATELLVLYLDGQRFGAHHILSAVGIDRSGKKHILGIELGATENAAAVKRLLTHLRDQGLATDRQYLFVIDGAKALRAAIDEVFGTAQHVQRCRNHKIQNVLDELPEEQYGQVLNLMRAAWKVRTAEEGEKRLEQVARLLEHDHATAAASLREGLAEMFTLQRLQVPPSLYKCLATTNVIESPHSGVRRRTDKVTRWREAAMVERWVAAAWLETETRFRRVDGHEDLWALATILERNPGAHKSAAKKGKIA